MAAAMATLGCSKFRFRTSMPDFWIAVLTNSLIIFIASSGEEAVTDPEYSTTAVPPDPSVLEDLMMLLTKFVTAVWMSDFVVMDSRVWVTSCI